MVSVYTSCTGHQLTCALFPLLKKAPPNSPIPTLRNWATVSIATRRLTVTDRHSLGLACVKPSNEISEAQDSERVRAKIQHIGMLST